MSDTSKCITIAVAQPAITINSIGIKRDGADTTTIYKGEDITRYSFWANITVSNGTPALITMHIYFGKDQNNLVEIGSGSIPGYSGTGTMLMDGSTLKSLYGYSTINDILNKANVASLTSCSYCIKIEW